MEPVDGNNRAVMDIDRLVEDITDEDERIFWETVSTDLDEEQRRRIVTPPEVFPHQEDLLAVHWHPEFVPLDLIEQRIRAMFPNAHNALIIPTQHNVLLTIGEYSGVEVDCFSTRFNQKVQLLLHMTADRGARASRLVSMLAYTARYRSSQLFDMLDTIVKPDKRRIEAAVEETGADKETIKFCRVYTKKLMELLDRNLEKVPPLSLKNKLLRDWFDALAPAYGDRAIRRAQSYLKAVKLIVKAEFSMKYFYRTVEIIEEARGLGARIVIPHPEQFWPILLADYDVNGLEVWNPQSHTLTDFLISVVVRTNSKHPPGHRRMLIFMGDDTHLGEKVRPPALQVKSKAGREIGVQPAWDDLDTRKNLIIANMDRADVINEYRERLHA
jgi:hypothetical protein